MPLGVVLSAEEGDPEHLRSEARELRRVAANIHSVAAMLRTISTKGVWDSCSGTTFADEVGTTPDTLVEVAERIADAERIVRPYADRLEEDIAYLTQQRERYERYVSISEARLARLQETPPEDPRYADADQRYSVAADERQRAKDRYLRRNEHALADERSVGRKLADVGPELADPGGYNAWEKSSQIGSNSLVNSPVVAIIPGVKLLGVVAVADPVGQLGRRVGYGEGSYRGVARSTAGSVVNIIVGRKGGAGATAKAEQRSTRLADDLAAVKKRYPTTSTASVASTRWTTRAGTTVRRASASTAVRLRHQAVDRLADKSGVRLVDDMAADWASLAGSGHVRKGAHVITYSVKAGDKAKGHVERIDRAKDQVDRVTSSEEKSVDSAR